MRVGRREGDGRIVGVMGDGGGGRRDDLER